MPWDIFLSTAAFAQTNAAPAAPSVLDLFMPLFLIVLVFYFLLIRPQQKRLKEHQTMLASIKRGDVVITAGGLIAKVVRIHDDELEVEVSPKIVVRVMKATITELRSKKSSA